jgi:hypothetical protein
MKSIKKTWYKMGAAMSVGMMAVLTPEMAYATTAAAGGNNFSKISDNMTKSVESLPGLLTVMSYLFGILLGVLGVMKIKDHVENPGQTALKDGAIRLAAGGALFALPILFESMLNTIGVDRGGVSAAVLKKATVTLN